VFDESCCSASAVYAASNFLEVEAMDVEAYVHIRGGHRGGLIGI